ncbi:peptidoglycan DD-metalloendopeptidase family protein [Paraburkholderia sp. J11-2]|uniref:peptidoglycan DD-metalloendopeptidase family protein n=1 Tax=Paraburkholderia sp. J11-2 TaxID=2805431 RepID=UPI002AB70CAB|nr:peptidoglycan DD-metalloendopeptidase family protein [Paraburkholderia sp. J11-2]
MNLTIGDRHGAVYSARRLVHFLIPVLCGSLAQVTGCSTVPGSQNCAPQSGALAHAELPLARAGYYRVNNGDTVASVASGFSRDPSLIAKWNGISFDSPLAAGQLLRVAPVANPVAANPTPACEAQPGADPAAHELAWPADGPVLKTFSAAGSKNMVIGLAPGAPVRAARGGRVVYVGSQIKAYGNLIVIRHDRHLLTAYGNAGRILTREGAVVTQGQAIAEMSDQPDGNQSLIFEVRKDRVPVDPAGLLTACHQAR